MMNLIELYVCTYGNENNEKGIVKLIYDKKENAFSKSLFIEMQGKANMVITEKDLLYTSEQRKEGNYLGIYDNRGNKIQEISCAHFYSWGCYRDEQLYLASFSDGLDSIYDCKKQGILQSYEHQDETGRTGRSHYITCLEKNVISIENALQKIYFYKKQSLEVEEILSFDDINIRLLSIHPSEKYAYMNTELTNEVIVLDLEKKCVLSSYKMSDSTGFSGGNSINKEGNRLAISVREENKIYVFEVHEEKISLIHSFTCGNIPRDLKIVDDLLFVTCTKDNRVEVYDLYTYQKLNVIEVAQPITFHM